ncbi:MAG: alpha/beta hydrolase [Gaiellales bacterium]
MSDSRRSPALVTLAPRGRVRAVALLAHGGSAKGTTPAWPMRTPALRMYPFLAGLHRGGRDLGLAACQLRYRVSGYNNGDPVEDMDWGLAEVSRRYGEVDVCLIGHSMGGRVCLRSAGHPSVRSVVALAPWLPPGEPTAQLAGRSVMIAHGVRDRITDPARSLAFALAAHPTAARLCRFEIARSGHTMLERIGLWQRLVRRLALQSLGLEPMDSELAAAFALPAQPACRIPL